MRPGATTSALRPIAPMWSALTTTAPAATSTRKNVPITSAKTRRHSYERFEKSRTHAGCRAIAAGTRTMGGWPTPAPGAPGGTGAPLPP